LPSLLDNRREKKKRKKKRKTGLSELFGSLDDRPMIFGAGERRQRRGSKVEREAEEAGRRLRDVDGVTDCLQYFPPHTSSAAARPRFCSGAPQRSFFLIGVARALIEQDAAAAAGWSFCLASRVRKSWPNVEQSRRETRLQIKIPLAPLYKTR